MFYRFERAYFSGVVRVTSVRVCHGPSCPITDRTDFCTLQVRSSYTVRSYLSSTLYVSASGKYYSKYYLYNFN